MPESRKRNGKKAHNKRVKARNERIKSEFFRANKEVRAKLESWKEEQKASLEAQQEPQPKDQVRDIRFKI